MLSYSRGLGIIFTIMVRGFNDLKNTYGKEGSEMIRLGFSNIVYLLSQDIGTLEEMSRLCGESSPNVPLVSIEDLKTLKPFEAIILTIRMMPFKTKMLPYFEIKK
jgi:type IV secretory pathway TraG/TraD family ATPase VirD4